MINQRRINEIEVSLNSMLRSIKAEVVPGLWEALNSQHVAYRETLNVEVPPTELPCSTLLFDFFSQEDYATGGMTLNEWRWVQRSYFDASNPRLAQEEMKVLIPALLDEFRAESTLQLPNGKVGTVRIADTGLPEPAEDADGSEYLVKSLEITVTTEEE